MRKVVSSSKERNSTKEKKMTTMTEIQPAIARSARHQEIVILLVDDAKEALEIIDNDGLVTELDWCRENDGSIDAWGNKAGTGDFRLRIREKTK
jgi:hypothetical protein